MALVGALSAGPAGRVVLHATGRTPNAAIAAWPDVHVDTVRKWRTRFAEDGLDGLADRPRSGRPRRFTPVAVAEVKALACELPATAGVALARSSCSELTHETSTRGICETVSSSTALRWLAADAINGEPLGDNDSVLSADEKPGIQAPRRIHPTQPPAPAGVCGWKTSTSGAALWPTW